MPSSTQRKPRVRREVVEELEEKPEPKTSRSTEKELPVSRIVSSTLTDRISATAAYAISGNMVANVGKEYAITPVEAYNIFYPTSRIIVYYLPSTIIKTNLPIEVADNLEKILITSLEYMTRIASGWVKNRFNKQLVKAGIREEDKPSRNPTPVSSPVDELEDIVGGINMPSDGESTNGQIPPGVSHFDYEELLADGAIVGDRGLNY